VTATIQTSFLKLDKLFSRCYNFFLHSPKKLSILLFDNSSKSNKKWNLFKKFTEFHALSPTLISKNNSFFERQDYFRRESIVIAKE